MAEIVTLPQLGSTMEEGIVVRWLKSIGDFVKAGEPLLEVETDKATIEVEAPASGILSELLAKEGELVPVRQPIALIGEGASAGVLNPPQHSVSTVSGAVNSVAETVATDSVAHDTDIPAVSPRARRLAAANNVDIQQLVGRGSGPYGRILERDVMAFIASPISTEETAKPPRLTPLAARIADDLGVAHSDLALGLPGSRIRSVDVMNAARQNETLSNPATAEADVTYDVQAMGNLQRRVADNVSRSAFTAPHVTLTLAVDMTECIRLRTLLLPAIEAAYRTRLSFTDMIVKAVALALVEHPKLNASLNGTDLRIHRKVNIGVAVALDDGLVVPVIHDADTKSLGLISGTLKKLVSVARDNRLTPDDLSGGTFAITNLGAFDIDHFDPIIATGQAAILGVCRIAETPVVVNGAVVVRSMMNLCLSFDHRITNGAPAAKFLQTIKQILEAPARLVV